MAVEQPEPSASGQDAPDEVPRSEKALKGAADVPAHNLLGVVLSMIAEAWRERRERKRLSRSGRGGDPPAG